MPKSILKQIEDAIFGVKKKTPSDYAFKVAKLEGTKRTYQYGQGKLEDLERQRKKAIIRQSKNVATNSIYVLAKNAPETPNNIRYYNYLINYGVLWQQDKKDASKFRGEKSLQKALEMSKKYKGSYVLRIK